MPDYKHCLRAGFTERMVQLLQRGRSINLIGREGTGRERLLEDIQQSNLPNTKIILVNMKNYRAIYDGLVREMWSQLGQEEEKPDNISALIERYEDRNEQIFFFLHNFDALLDTPDVDPTYNVTFYDALNYIKNKPNIALVCVTQKPHNQSVVFVEGKPHSNSWLDLEQRPLPPLTHEEIVYEVKRQPLSLTIKEQSAMIDVIRRHETPYKLLTYLREKIFNRENADLVFQKRLKKWLKQFSTEERRRALSKKGVYAATQEIRTWGELTGISRLKTPFLLLGDIGKFITEILKNLTKKSGNNDNA